jgi:hypothetical protein
MRKFGPQISFLSLLLAAAITLACGSSMAHVSPNCTSSAITANATGIPQSIRACPVSADAKDFLDGQVEFIATGYYLNQPPVAPLTNAYWVRAIKMPSP